MHKIKALDTFAGTGWGVACKWLNIEEDGVEIMPEAVATREANGMTTIYRDVWEGILLSKEEHEAKYGTYDLKISSPPCQTFSVAGSGAGRRALDEVIEAIQLHAYKDPQELLAFGRKYDMRTALVLTPLAYIWRDMPRLVALEQVPTVLPVWEAYAEIMRELGYDVQTAILNAEQYGVPQTRRRAILVARLDGQVKLPKPTHSRYYSRTPEKLDPGVKKWVSMADALGWGRHVPSPTYCNSGHGGAGIEWGGNSVRKAMREQSVTGKGWTPKDDVTPGTNDAIRVTTADAAALQSYPVAAGKNMGRGMVERHGDRPGRQVDEPAFTLRANAGGTEPGGFVWKNEDGTTRKLEPTEAATLQSYAGETMVGFPRLSDGRGGVLDIEGVAYRARDLRPAGEPALTITEKARSWKVFGADGSERRITTAEAGALQSYPSEVNEWAWANAPAPTVAADPRLAPRGCKHPQEGCCSAYPGAPGRQFPEGTIRLSTNQASTLQTFDKPFVWCGAKTKQYLQIGNAVPPLLARAVLSALIADNKELETA